MTSVYMVAVKDSNGEYKHVSIEDEDLYLYIRSLEASINNRGVAIALQRTYPERFYTSD